MSTYTLIRPASGLASSVATVTDVGTTVSNVLGNDVSRWDVRYSNPDKWIIFTGKDTLAQKEKGRILLLPSNQKLMASESLLMMIWSFISTTNANVSFDSDIGFLYDEIVIVGDSDIENGIDSKVEQELGKDGRNVERIKCQTAQDLVDKLKARRNAGKFLTEE